MNTNVNAQYTGSASKVIDFVLVSQLLEDHDKITMRSRFEYNLKDMGFILKKEYVDDVRFVSIHAPMFILKFYAEMTRLHMPTEATEGKQFKRVRNFLKCMDYDREAIPDQDTYFTALFTLDKEDCFLYHQSPTFFSQSERSSLVSFVLKTISFVPNSNEGRHFGIQNLISEGIYEDAFPPHSGDPCEPTVVSEYGPIANDRYLLYTYWASLSCIFKVQPLDLIHRYYGSNVAFYFTWLGFYTKMLIPVAGIGFIVFFYGIFHQDDITDDICNRTGAGNYTMCPLCDKVCPFWKLYDWCDMSKARHYFDNDLMVFFAFTMSLWSVVFQELWKRTEAKYRFLWHVNDFEKTEFVRPEYQALAARPNIKLVINPNDQLEPILPGVLRCQYLTASIIVIASMLFFSSSLAFFVILYRVFLTYWSKGSHDYTNLIPTSVQSIIIVNISPSFLNLILIFIMGRLFKKIAAFMTSYEKPRTESEWENSFIVKVFLFGFVNNFSYLFFIAFVKDFYIGPPNKYNWRILPGRQRLAECEQSCFFELATQLVIVMMGKEFGFKVIDFGKPRFKRWISEKLLRKKRQTKKWYETQWAQDYDLVPTKELGLVNEYLDTIIQFGFVTMFAPVFPLAPLAALLNNLLDIRIDARKYTLHTRRPIAKRSKGLHIWFFIINGLSKVAVVTNALFIAVTSDFIPTTVYRYNANTFDLHGYINFSLSVFDVADFEPEGIPKDPTFQGVRVKYCRYFDFRTPPTNNEKYEPTITYWKVQWWRLIFIIGFASSVMLTNWLIQWLIPDVSITEKYQRMREKHINRTMVKRGARTMTMSKLNPLTKYMFSATDATVEHTDNFSKSVDRHSRGRYLKDQNALHQTTSFRSKSSRAQSSMLDPLRYLVSRQLFFYTICKDLNVLNIYVHSVFIENYVF